MNLSGWHQHIDEEITKSYFIELQHYLTAIESEGKTILPPLDRRYEFFKLTPFKDVKVVILGQDPYHGLGQAHGLCFSVKEGNRIPPSLRNIFKELNADVGAEIPKSGELTAWARRGVLMLNSILTVEEKKPASHKGKGWEQFTDRVLQVLSEEKEGLVFILWGNYARSKKSLLDESKHLILEAPHPAAEVYAGGKAGFFGSRPFSKANEYLNEPVDWGL